VSQWEPPLWFDRLGGIAWRSVVIVVAGAIIVGGIVAFGAVILPVVLGLLFTCALRPVAAWLRRHVRPGFAAALSVLLLAVAIIAVVWLTINAVVDQWSEIETLIDDGRTTMIEALEDRGVAPETAATLQQAASDAVGAVVDILFHGLVQIVPTIAGVIAAVVLSLLVTFFFVKDGAAIWAWIVGNFDTSDALVDRVGRRVWPVIAGYILGQTAIAAIDATLITLGALLLGVPEAGAVLLITFFGAYVPYIGATVAGFVAVMLAVAEGGIDTGVAMLAIVLGVQMIEGNLLQPWIQGRAVRLHPLVIALAVTAGGALAGFLGVFLAVPVTAAGFVALAELRAAGVLGTRSTDRVDAISPPAT
jgi:predicted PurR-regulated permease PerM